MLLQCEEVGQRLARMFKFAERVDHGHARIGSHLFHRRMAESAQHDDVDPTLQVVGDIIERFARRQAAGSLVDKESAPAQAIHAGLKGKAGAQRRLLKKHDHLLAGKNAAEVRGPLLEHGRVRLNSC